MFGQPWTDSLFVKRWCYTIIVFKDLTTRKSDIHRDRKAEVNITFKDR